MRRADALALLGHGGRAALLYTGKIYEYLTSGQPVLAVLDAGPAAGLLRRAGHEAVYGSSDAAGVAGWIAPPGGYGRPAGSVRSTLRKGSAEPGNANSWPVGPPKSCLGSWTPDPRPPAFPPLLLRP